MDSDTLAALRKSIQHWEENVAAKEPDAVSLGSDACALCNMFHKNRCVGCPVADATKSWRCNNSPYADAEVAYEDWIRTFGTRDEFREAAQRELDFLRSLLPSTEPSHA